MTPIEEAIHQILTDLVPREKEHNGVSQASEIFVRNLVPRVLLALRNVNETAANSGYNDTYFAFEKLDESVVEAALMGLRGEAL